MSAREKESLLMPITTLYVQIFLHSTNDWKIEWKKGEWNVNDLWSIEIVWCKKSDTSPIAVNFLPISCICEKKYAITNICRINHSRGPKRGWSSSGNEIWKFKLLCRCVRQKRTKWSLAFLLQLDAHIKVILNRNDFDRMRRHSKDDRKRMIWLNPSFLLRRFLSKHFFVVQCWSMKTINCNCTSCTSDVRCCQCILFIFFFHYNIADRCQASDRQIYIYMQLIYRLSLHAF